MYAELLSNNPGFLLEIRKPKLGQLNLDKEKKPTPYVDSLDANMHRPLYSSDCCLEMVEEVHPKGRV